MSIESVAGVQGAWASAMTGAVPTGQVEGPQAPQALSGVFGADLAGAVDQLQALQSQSDALAVQAVTGDLDDVHDYTIAATQSAVALELTAALRNKAVDAFTEIMRMQA